MKRIVGILGVTAGFTVASVALLTGSADVGDVVYVQREQTKPPGEITGTMKSKLLAAIAESVKLIEFEGHIKSDQRKKHQKVIIWSPCNTCKPFRKPVILNKISKNKGSAS